MKTIARIVDTIMFCAATASVVLLAAWMINGFFATHTIVIITK